jgi:hypothetical protein
MEITVVRMVVFGFALFRLPPRLLGAQRSALTAHMRPITCTKALAETKAHDYPSDVSIRRSRA